MVFSSCARLRSVVGLAVASVLVEEAEAVACSGKQAIYTGESQLVPAVWKYQPASHTHNHAMFCSNPRQHLSLSSPRHVPCPPKPVTPGTSLCQAPL
jgi:hypothetical protein